MLAHDITRITHISWGHMEVTVGGQTFKFKDCKVWPGGAKAWDWNQTGTQHQPGIQPGDIEEILDQNIEVIILSRGMQLMLNVCSETEELLKSKGIEFHIEQTRKAVEKFNEFAEKGKRAGGIFHSTC